MVFYTYVFLLHYVLFLCFVKSNDVELNKGYLTPDCVSKYYRIFVTRRVPPRNYQYFHEVMPSVEGSSEVNLESNELDVKFRIVGGNPVSIKQVPYQVLYGLYCGGSLIAPDWVITAAHCKGDDDFILVGSTYRSKATQYQVCAHFFHPLWTAANKTHFHDYDFQLLLLEKAVPVSLMSRPIAIGNVDDIKVGQMISVSGWGHTQYKQSSMQDIVRRVSIPIIADETCKSLHISNYRTITPRMFCAAYPDGKKDACQGDSGGPAVVNGKLVGLVSFGIGCADPDHPGVYSIIPIARDWIRRVTGLPL